MNAKELVSKFNYNHDIKYSKKCYNYPIKKKFHNCDGYRILKKTNKDTFEYGGITTTVDIIPNYINMKGTHFTWIYISTKDDSCMSLWLSPQSKENIRKLVRAYENKLSLVSCYNEFSRLSKIMDWGFIDADDYYYKRILKKTVNKYTGKVTYEYNEEIMKEVKDVDFN